MIHSNKRKLALSGWLQQHNNMAYNTPLRLQKYPFFYEAFCKVSGEQCDFDRLRGYKRGPVFSAVWGDYTKDRDKFNTYSMSQYERGKDFINENFAKRASFVVSTLSETELSEITHKYNIWSLKSDRIMAGEQQVDLSEDDFLDDDYKLTKMLEMIYPDTMIENSVALPVGEKFFVVSKEDMKRLTEQHMDTLSLLSEQRELQNPVFIAVDEGGGLIVN